MKAKESAEKSADVQVEKINDVQVEKIDDVEVVENLDSIIKPPEDKPKFSPDVKATDTKKEKSTKPHDKNNEKSKKHCDERRKFSKRPSFNYDYKVRETPTILDLICVLIISFHRKSLITVCSGTWKVLWTQNIFRRG